MDRPATHVPGRACPVCGQLSSRPFLTKGQQILVACDRCRFVYATSLPIALETYYTRHGHYYVSADKLQSDFSPVRYRREVDLLHQCISHGSVLDVGCSTGGFLAQLGARFPNAYRTWGIDISQPAVAHAQSRGLNVQCAEFADAEFSSGSFDAITFWAVMEHVIDPATYLHRAAGLLRSGGWCFILVPNLRSLAVRLLGKRYRYFMEEHLNWFSVSTLRQFLALEPAMELHLITSTHFNPIVIAQDAYRPREAVPAADRAALLKRTTRWKEQPLLWPLRMGYAFVERCLAPLHLADNLVLVAQRREPDWADRPAADP